MVSRSIVSLKPKNFYIGWPLQNSSQRNEEILEMFHWPQPEEIDKHKGKGPYTLGLDFRQVQFQVLYSFSSFPFFFLLSDLKCQQSLIKETQNIQKGKVAELRSSAFNFESVGMLGKKKFFCHDHYTRLHIIGFGNNKEDSISLALLSFCLDFQL